MAVHATAIIEPGVEIGRNTAIWDHVHVRHSTSIGEECIIGEKTYVAYGVRIGDRVKINAYVYICAGVTIEDGVMISAGTVFTNDRFPRATTPDLRQLLSSDPNEETLSTTVRRGATIGAQSTIGGGITIGRFAMIGMGSVVTHDIADHVLALGNPARPVDYVCACGSRLHHFGCLRCGRRYAMRKNVIVELEPTIR